MSTVDMNWRVVEEEILAIEGNGPVLEELYKLLDAGEAIGLVGSGASADLWPLWDQFLEGLIRHCLECRKIDRGEAAFLLKEALQTPLETAQQVRNRLGDNLYFRYLQKTFRDKTSPQTAAAFTLTHKALMRLPIHNYLTLNYDAGLTNARAALYPRATTSYYFWDQEEAKRILDRGFKRLVLHAHGRHDRAESIILTLDDYHRAYSHRPFARLLEHLFGFENLIIVGFGMSDPYIKQLCNNVSRDYKRSPLRHVALVGLGDRDIRVASLLRERTEMVYGARLLFYPANNNHRALTNWLSALAEKYSSATGSGTAEEIHRQIVCLEVKRALVDEYVHEPTDDENFKGRQQNFETLNRWSNDPATRTIGVTGIGGQGKTALVGRWLKRERSAELVNMPVFYWSFYEDLDVGGFLEQFVKFLTPVIKTKGRQAKESVSFLLEAVCQVRLLLVLDGLEVLQEEATGHAHGRINHPILQQLLQQWVCCQHQSLMILTSRFRFPDLARYSGAGFHNLKLMRLSRKDGISLLEKLGIQGEDKLKGGYVEKLYGHPLALRVLASTVKRCYFGDLSQFKDKRILGIKADDRLSRKLGHLLNFYESQLKGGQKELLGIISLFKRPLERKTFVTLLGKMKSLENTPLAKVDEASVQRQLDLLIGDFLVEKTRDGITTHPVIRDYFRQRLKISGSRHEVARFLISRPGTKRPRNIEETRNLVDAVQLLCDEGELKTADDLYRSRLSQGGFGFNVFKNLPALAEGLECAFAFVGNKIRRKKVEKTLGKPYLAFYFDEASLIDFFLGNFQKAIEWRNKCLGLRISRRPSGMDSRACDLIEISRIEGGLGNLTQAQRTVSRALRLADDSKELIDFSVGFSAKGYYEFLLGNIAQAYYDFEIALCYEQKRSSVEQFLYSLRGNQQAEFLIRIKAWNRFQEVNEWNLEMCQKNHWNDKLGVCCFLQGWYHVCRAQLPQAERFLTEAESVLRPSGWVEQICRLDLGWALLAEAKGEHQKGLQKVNECLPICVKRGFRLLHADHLTVRGRLYLMQYEQEKQEDEDIREKAGDDGYDALKVAEDTGYVWGKTDALELLGWYHRARAELSGLDSQDEKDLAHHCAKDAEAMRNNLHMTKEQMEKLEGQAQQKFRGKITFQG